MSIGPLYVIVIYYIKIFLYNWNSAGRVLGSRDRIRSDVETNWQTDHMRMVLVHKDKSQKKHLGYKSVSFSITAGVEKS